MKNSAGAFPTRRSVILGGILLLAVIGHLFVGHSSLNWNSLLTEGVSSQQWFILQEFRLPRVLMAIIVGAGLAVAGVALQALFRNPLAEPGLIGVASSSAFGAVAIMVLGGWLWQQVALWQIGFFAFASGLLATLLIYRLATKSGQTDIALMLLAGVAVNAIMGAATQLLLSVADLVQLRTVTFWLMGSLVNLSWPSVVGVSTVVLFCTAVLWRLVRAMNAFVLGENSARYMGYDTGRFKWQVMIFSALMVSSAVSVVGVIGFVGLVVPHIVRLWVGSDHRLVLPLSALGGAILLVLADWLARVLLHPLELPIGLLMALIGAPFFLMMLLKQRRGWRQ
ncbi:iron ABC transporter permease [Thiomicrorhabdus sp. 6S3-12]|uniref:FecCD family ABC transporter permease n=1 Tax=Thiomicrorhabdus sp. 6S3-12 TaxID=2819681 RepID=UPI001FB5DD74|nr:iron ABC transporter permease [Thiomicrorhabdus sp. 6S3-12]